MPQRFEGGEDGSNLAGALFIALPEAGGNGLVGDVQQHSAVCGSRGGPGGGANCRQRTMRSDEEKAAPSCPLGAKRIHCRINSRGAFFPNPCGKRPDLVGDGLGALAVDDHGQQAAVRVDGPEAGAAVLADLDHGRALMASRASSTSERRNLTARPILKWGMNPAILHE